MDSSSVDPGAEEAVDEADDWVAVRCGAFSPRDPQGGRARFLVGWNEGGRQFAITAHICWPSEKASAACRTPGRDQSSRKDRSSNLMKTIGADGDDDDDYVGLGVLVDDAWEDEGKSLKMKDWEEEFDEDVKAEGDGASRILSFAGLLTPAEMLSTHSEVSLLCPSLAAYLPPTPLGEVEGASSGGFWSLLFPLPPPEPVSDAQRAELCGAMEHYLSGISDSCGWRAVVWLLFRSTVAGQDDDDDGAITEEECYESLGEVHRKALHDELRRMKKEILALLAQHNSATSLVDLLALYDKEDVSVENVLSAAASLHHFLLQPFRELRALASLRRQQFRRQLDRGGLGPLRVNELRRQRDVWTECERNATSRIEDITLKHYTFTSQILRVMLRAMQADSGRFGASAWDSATPRMLRLAVSVAMETLQCNQATELVLVQKRRELKRQMLSLSRSALEEPCVVDDTERTGFQIQSAQPLVQLNRLESKCYDLELRVCDTRLHSLRLREQLISSHRHALQREMQEIDDSVCYHDTFESLEAMQEVGEMGLVASGDKERLCSQDLDLQARLADILSERARLRIKKERCISRRREKLHEQQEHERRWNLHHAVQLRREQQRESEGQRRDWLQQERQRTVQRLHEYRQKHPNEVISHPQRLKNLTRLKHEDHVTSTLVKVGRSLGRTTRTGRLRCNRQSQEIPVQIFCKHGVGTETDKTISACPSSLQLPQSFEQQSQQPPKAPPLPPTALTPPSAPPPPPPLPTTGFSEKESSKARDSTHRLDEKGKAFPSHHSPPASFDPNELVRARERLRKAETGPGVFTPERNDSPMDEVLASLKLGAFSLRKVGATQRDRKTEHLEPKPETLMDQIRKGVQLRQTPPATTRHGYHGDDPLTQSIRLAMQRIKEASPDSEDDGEVEGEAEESSGDWDI